MVWVTFCKSANHLRWHDFKYRWITIFSVYGLEIVCNRLGLIWKEEEIGTKDAPKEANLNSRAQWLPLPLVPGPSDLWLAITVTKAGSCCKVPQVYKTNSRNFILFVQLIVAKLNSFDVEEITPNHDEVNACNKQYTTFPLKHRRYCKKLPWELVGCKGVKVFFTKRCHYSYFFHYCNFYYHHNLSFWVVTILFF